MPLLSDLICIEIISHPISAREGGKEGQKVGGQHKRTQPTVALMALRRPAKRVRTMWTQGGLIQCLARGTALWSNIHKITIINFKKCIYSNIFLFHRNLWNKMNTYISGQPPMGISFAVIGCYLWKMSYCAPLDFNTQCIYFCMRSAKKRYFAYEGSRVFSIRSILAGAPLWLRAGSQRRISWIFPPDWEFSLTIRYK